MVFKAKLIRLWKRFCSNKKKLLSWSKQGHFSCCESRVIELVTRVNLASVIIIIMIIMSIIIIITITITTMFRAPGKIDWGRRRRRRQKKRDKVVIWAHSAKGQSRIQVENFSLHVCQSRWCHGYETLPKNIARPLQNIANAMLHAFWPNLTTTSYGEGLWQAIKLTAEQQP